MTSDSPEVTSSAAWLNANVQASADANHNISSFPIGQSLATKLVVA